MADDLSNPGHRRRPRLPPVAHKENCVKLLPDARLVVIKIPATPLDQPEVFNATLLDMLKTVDTTTQDH